MKPQSVQTEYFVLQPCRTSAAFEALPRRKRRLRLGEAGDRLRARGFEIVHDAGVLLLVRGACDASVFENGKLLLKTTDRALALQEAQRITLALEAVP